MRYGTSGRLKLRMRVIVSWPLHWVMGRLAGVLVRYIWVALPLPLLSGLCRQARSARRGCRPLLGVSGRVRGGSLLIVIWRSRGAGMLMLMLVGRTLGHRWRSSRLRLSRSPGRGRLLKTLLMMILLSVLVLLLLLVVLTLLALVIVAVVAASIRMGRLGLCHRVMVCMSADLWRSRGRDVGCLCHM